MRTICKIMLLLLALLPTGCTVGRAAADEWQAFHLASAQGAGQPTGQAQGEPGAPLTPAPAAYSQAQARRWYSAQLAAYSQATPRKMKNSGNTNQQIHNGPTTGQMSLASGAIFLMGAVVGVLATRYIRKS